MTKRTSKRGNITEKRDDDASSDSEKKHHPHASDEKPTHREDFIRLLGAAARKRERED